MKYNIRNWNRLVGSGYFGRIHHRFFTSIGDDFDEQLTRNYWKFATIQRSMGEPHRR